MNGRCPSCGEWGIDDAHVCKAPTPSPGGGKGEEIERGDEVEVIGPSWLGANYLGNKGFVERKMTDTTYEQYSVSLFSGSTIFPGSSLRLVSKSSPSSPGELVVGQEVWVRAKVTAVYGNYADVEFDDTNDMTSVLISDLMIPPPVESEVAVGKVKRYTPKSINWNIKLVEDENGEVVLASEYDKLLKQLASIGDDLRGIAVSCLPTKASLFHEIDSVIRKLDALSLLGETDAQQGGE